MLRDNTTKLIAKFLYEEIIICYRCPIELRCDQDVYFVNKRIQLLTKKIMIQHWKSTTYYLHENK